MVQTRSQFDQTPQAQNPGSYVGLSEGIRSSPHDALAGLFEGIGRAIEGGAKEGDRIVQENIKQDIFDQTDAVQAEFGVPEATDMESDVDTAPNRVNAPAGVQRAGRQLDALATAYARGALKESHYWARMNSMVRQLRGKYPGYREVIDEMVSGVTGAKPANALRSALMREWDEAVNAGSKKSKLDEMEEWAVKQGHLPVDYYQRKAGESPYTETELMAHISRRTRDVNDDAARKADMALEAENKKLIPETVEQNARIEFNTMVTNLLQDTASSTGMTYGKLQERIREAQAAAAAGKPMDQASVEQMRGQMGQLKMSVRTALQQQFTASWDGNPQNSYLNYLNKDKMNDLIDQAMLPISILEQALTSENPWGVLGVQQAWMEAQKSDSTKRLLSGVPLIGELQAVQSTLGPDGLARYMTLDPSIQSELDTNLINYRKLQAARAKSNGTTVDQALQDGIDKGRGADYYKALTTHWQKLVAGAASGTMDTETLANNVQYMFGDEASTALSKMDAASKVEWYKRVASPGITKQMMKLRDEGDTESWQLYQRWVAQGFQAIFQERIHEVQSFAVDADWSVRWDNVQHRFVGAFVGTDNPLRRTSSATKAIDTTIKSINDAIQIIDPIFKDAKGDTKSEVLELLMAAGYDPGAPEDSSFITKVGNALYKSYAREKEGGRGIFPGMPNLGNMG